MEADSGGGRVQLSRLAAGRQPMGERRQGWLTLVVVLPGNRGVTLTGSDGLSFLLPSGLAPARGGSLVCSPRPEKQPEGKVLYPVL